MRHLRIGTQLALWVGVVSALAVGALVFVMIRSTDRAFDAKIHEDLDHVARLSAGEVDALAEALDSAADHAADVLTSRLAGTFELDAEATVEIAGKPTPRLTRDGQPLNLDLGAVDAFTRDTGAVATVFARSGDDFVRVTTSLQKEDGSRAVGTPLGEAHPARAELLAGKPFAGPAVLFGRFYLTRYRPVRDAANRVVGALFVGLDCTRQRDAILARLGQVRLGERGFVWIVDGRAGPNRGRVLLHPTFAGKNATQPGDQVPEYVRSVLASQPGPLEFDAGADLRTTSIADVAGWGWRVVADASRNETEMASRRVARTVGALGVAVVVAFSATSGWFIRRRLRPLEGIVSAAHRIGEGDLTTPVAYARQDEIGELAGAMNAAMSSISEMVDGIHRRTAGLGHASESAAETSARMTSGADRVAELAQRVAASADQGSSNIHSVAAAVEEMGASIQEIAKNAAEAAAVASEASTAARGAAEKIASLDQLSTEIGNVVKLVTSIAEQTNLLALNATIEAARAGEAGKGFAVVANEVKTLASATANATGEISKTIDAIQAGTSGSVRTIGEIGTIVERVTELQSAIAAAVEEQTSVTREISMNVASAAEASREISAEVGGVADAAASTSSGAQETARSAAEVREVNQELTRLVKRFRTGAAASAVPSFGAASVR